MSSRDSQTVLLSRQTILLVTAVGVGLLTLCYVLGVQVGKQSAALRGPALHGSGEDLQELPASISDQLKALEQSTAAEAAAPAPPADASAAPGPAAAGAPKVPAPKEVPMGAPPKAAAEPAPANPAAGKPDKKPADAQRWTLQLVSTPDPDEAQRMVSRLRSAGFPSAVVHEKGLYKVRLTQAGTRDTADATATRLKNRGFKPFAMKVEQP